MYIKLVKFTGFRKRESKDWGKYLHLFEVKTNVFDIQKITHILMYLKIINTILIEVHLKKIEYGEKTFFFL